MVLLDPFDAELDLDQLADRTGFTPRTIRSYVARGLIPPPSGRGPAAAYGREHLVPLLFFKHVRSAVPYDLSLGVLENLLRSLPPEQVLRIARGEEGVSYLPLLGEAAPSPAPRPARPPLFQDEPSLALSMAAPEPVLAAPVRPAKPPAAAPSASASPWLSVDVTPDLRLSIRGADAAAARTLDDLAARLRGWLSARPPG